MSGATASASPTGLNQIPPDRRPDTTDPHSGVTLDEYVELPNDPDEITTEDTEDGGMLVTLPGGPEDEDSSQPLVREFYANLAEVLPDVVKGRVVTDLMQRIEEDKKAREMRDKQYEEGLKRTGLGKDAPGGAEFEGASRVVHPLMTEACIDYAARIMKELLPPDGPVKPKILGVVTQEKSDRARRKTEHMNWQITTQMPEARSVFETLFTQVPLGGSQIVHLWWDQRLRRPRTEFRPIDHWYIPYSAASFASAHRRTYEEQITATEFKLRVDQGLYMDVDIASETQMPEATKSQTASDKIEGVEEPGENRDGLRSIYETQVLLHVTEEMEPVLRDAHGPERADELAPYIITIDVTTRQMVSMYRAWERGDAAREPIEHDFEFGFLPWRGALSIGFPQIIGGLSAAATGALRALLDSAHVNNVPSGFIKKGSGTSGQNRRPSPGELTEIDAGLESDDIRKVVMPAPFNPPSAVLFQLLGFVVEAGRGIVRTTLDETPMGQGNTPVPVGTQLSRVEEGMVVFSSVHGRAHAALNRFLAGLHRLNRLYLPQAVNVDAAGKEVLVRRSDYEGPCDIQPTSNPTIYSDQQRLAQVSYIQQRAAMVPGMYDVRAVELATLRLIKWPDPETLLTPAPKPHELNQVNECLAMVMGQPVSVFPEQDHLAHLRVLAEFIQSPVLGASPLMAPVFLPAAVKHATQHIAYLYVEMMVQTLGQAAGLDPAQLMDDDPKLKRQFDGLLATASPSVIGGIAAALQALMPVFLQAQQHAAQFQPPAPVDPAAAAAEAAKAETTRKATADQAGHAIDSGRLQIQQQANAIQADRVQAMREATATQAQTRLQQTEIDSQTALDIAEQRAAGGSSASHYVNGESISPGG
jgi:chaperonin GroES